MTAGTVVDFAQWVTPDLVLPLRGELYQVRPPTVEAAQQIIAAAARAEINLGIAKGPVSAEVQEILDGIGPDDHPALGEAYEWMVANGVPAPDIDRAAYYAVFYWAKGRDYADKIARALWAPAADGEAPEESPAPKERPTSPPKSGRASGSGNRSTGTRTASRSSRTTASPRSTTSSRRSKTPDPSPSSTGPGSG